MKGKFSRLVPLAVAGLLAAVLAWRSDEAMDVTQAPVVSAPAERVSDAVVVRSYAKRQVVRDIVAGRHSLLTAAALFRELDRLPPEPPDLAPESLDQLLGLPPAPSRSADERRCWQVIIWVRSAQTDGLSGRDAAAARLEAELWERMLSREGLRLPDAGSLPPIRELLAQARDAMAESQRNAGRGRAGGECDGR
jgi:hypothetical protein